MDWRGETMALTIDGQLMADGPNIVLSKGLHLTVHWAIMIALLILSWATFEGWLPITGNM